MASREWLSLEARQVLVKVGNQGFTAFVQTTIPEELIQDREPFDHGAVVKIIYRQSRTADQKTYRYSKTSYPN